MEKYADKVFKVIAAYVEEISTDVEHGRITPDSMLSPLGLDSVGRALLIEVMLERFGLSVPRFEFYQANNLGELAEIFARKLREKEMSDADSVQLSISALMAKG